ncbi:class I SAM-dependent methyltransferase [Actinocorallia sp. API 0066]|uniref:O-methyltransferase n=1 Tax=Actinocorallia sp. API 0066 TaxID=2896846 RepID=UPI001E28AF42|nr:class I SAM-dependent methyltransferase [Actinocorallia sp. API 0066]MCD0447590.1 class I SAM-dependent methyltransferase [Actinocorallia sp. API 0066]
MAGQVEVSDALRQYVREVSLRDDEVLRELAAETAGMSALAAMVTMPEEGQLLGLLTGLVGARDVLELGTFTGYGALCMARALPPGGRLVTCDISERWTRIAQRYWARAGVADRIELRLDQAAKVLEALLAERGPDSFDLVFIDADKTGYPDYFERALTLVRPGGLIILDNTLFFGRVVDPAAQDLDTLAIRELNAALRDDDRVELSLIPMADGITLARKLAPDPRRSSPTDHHRKQGVRHA